MEKCRRTGESRIRDRFLGRPQGRMHHFDALDGLRGLAVLVVIASHLSNVGLLPQPGLSGTGKAGVYLFFVLSAFLLTRILLARSLRALADLRFCRITCCDGCCGSGRCIYVYCCCPGR